jgi:chromosome segregation protein
LKILRLELFGFKSFKDKTIVTFNQPITAIVGSNGCGKSNVVDALYWVMGDMSPKHLRGSVMTDVIFSGSKDTAPLDMAEVTLVLERDPEKDAELPPQFNVSSEIQITRRYYRSGESEYLINKVQCRLRDIQEFFMDTGMGAKAYSIVEQGAITRMISLKAEDRRVVIEEVAGVMKFKARKAETQRKIENSQLNLQRVDDIVTDLQKQLSALKRQADKAEKFKTFSEKLKALEVRLGTREWVSRSGEKSNAILQSAELKNALSTIQAQIETERVSLETIEQEVQQQESAYDSKRAEVRVLELQVKDFEAQISNLATKKESLVHREQQNTSTLLGLETRSSEIDPELEKIFESIRSFDEQVEASNLKKDSLDQELAAAQESLVQKRAALDDCRKRLHQEDILSTRMAQDLQSLQRSLSHLENQKVSLATQIDELTSNITLKNSERSSTMGSLEAAFATRSELEQEKARIDESLSQLDAQRQDLGHARDDIKTQLTTVQIKKSQLEALERDLEGVEATAKSIVLRSRADGHESKTLADLIKVPTAFEKAVEAVLGRNLQRVVAQGIEDVEPLRRLIEQDSSAEARRGRAPLWISQKSQSHRGLGLDQIYMSPKTDAAPAFNQAPSEVPGPDGLMAQSDLESAVALSQFAVAPTQTVYDFLLSYEPIIGPLNKVVTEGLAGSTDHNAWIGLLSDFWVVRDRGSLVYLAEQLKDVPVGLVSLDGDVLHPNGFLDLAPVEQSANDDSGLIARKRVIADLKTREQVLLLSLEEAQTAFDRNSFDLGQAKETFRQLTSRLAALNPDVERHTTFLRQVESQLARLTEKKDLLSAQRDEAVNESEQLGTRINALTLDLESQSIKKDQLKIDFENFDADLRQTDEAVKAQKMQLDAERNQLRELEKQLSQVQSQRAALEQERMLLKTRIEQLKNECVELATQMTEVQTESEAFELKKTVADAEFRRNHDEEQEFGEALTLIRLKLKESSSELEKHTQESNQIELRLRDLEQTVAVQDVELKNIAEKLEVQYQIALASLDEQKLKELSTADDIEELAEPEKAKEFASQLRKKIDNLGRINMVAIDEFEEVKRRHEYLYIQRQDLSDAINQLKDAIDRIDRESKDRFTEAFHAVNAAFQETFPVLFGGGSAELRLTDPTNMLETGVEIVAQPPGKKLQNITLLSGGEKALTAVSLIFGIFSIKPSPFCVLDEVDAPLDDANVGRFNNLVRKITDRSQVIMITHHKKTMESCDALFGVTMEQPGISKVASVRIAELA